MTGATVASAVDTFLHSPRCANPNTQRAYRNTLGRLAVALGADRPLAAIDDDELVVVLTRLWGTAAAATWNRNRAAVVGWLGWCTATGEQAPALPVDRRPPASRPAGPLDPTAVETLLNRVDVPLRERTLWWMLYETAARATEILGLDVEHLDLRRRRTRPDARVEWGAGTAHLLPRLLAGRRRGPVFLSDRRPPPARRPPRADLCPLTGRARLGYDRARVLLDLHTRPAAGAPGWDLHQLRHAALAHR